MARVIVPPDAPADDEPLDDELLALLGAAADDDELELDPHAASTNARMTVSRVAANGRVYLFTEPPPKEVEIPRRHNLFPSGLRCEPGDARGARCNEAATLGARLPTTLHRTPV
jgi:hypothetical protein